MRSIVRKVIQMAAVVLVVTFFTAILTELLPGDPCETMIPFGTEADREACREDNGLDDPIVVRYVTWAGNFFTGDMGEYFGTAGLKGDDVFERVQDSLPRSLLIVLYVQILTLLIAIPLGVLTAYKANSVLDRSGNAIAFGLLAIPAFVLASLLKYWFGVRYDIFPTRGFVPLGDNLVEHFKSVALPVITITLGQIAVYARLLRSDMVATLQEDFILMAKAKGMPNRRILLRHALRPSSLTLLTVAGLNIGALVSGALIVEVIFDLDGIGGLIFDAISRRQYIALQSFVAVVALLYVLVNFFVDLLYTILDPRIRNV